MELKESSVFMQKLLITGLLTVCIFACKNAEIEHPDFDYTTGYFPYQYPVRTLILGDDIYDNSNDNAGKFLISVAMGGVYQNKKDRAFTFRIDESLCNNVQFKSNGAEITALPSNYYTLSSPETIVIPKGKVNGGVEVQLSEAFFNDPRSISLGYVVPLVLTGSNDVDSILVGNSSHPQPDRRNVADWITTPKDFTMFAIKYINEFHGNYFHYGEAYVNDSEGNRLEEREYKKEYVEQNDVRFLQTTARHQVAWKTFLQSNLMGGELNLVLNFNGDQCTITSADSQYEVTGTGEFKRNAYQWGNKPRNGIQLEYTVSDGQHTYHAKEDLVVRDRAITMEVYEPVVIETTTAE
jgi:hypothetical protein